MKVLQFGTGLYLRFAVFDDDLEFHLLAVILLSKDRFLLFNGRGNEVGSYVARRKVARFAGLDVLLEESFHFWILWRFGVVGVLAGASLLLVQFHPELVTGIFPFLHETDDTVPVLPVAVEPGDQGVILETVHRIDDVGGGVPA